MNGLDDAIADNFILTLLAHLGISAFKHASCGSLSGGAKRKVSTAIAIMLPRTLVVLDEVSTGLDPYARHQLWETVQLLNIGRTTIMTTHYIEETSVCDRISIMNAGKIKCCDTEYAPCESISNGFEIVLEFENAPDMIEELSEIISALLNLTMIFQSKMISVNRLLLDTW
jgi:ABC-type multidrug transport system ATPase subunit